MQVSVETTQGLERKLKVMLPPEQIDKKVNEKLQKLKKTASIKGFRPGKVPESVIKDRYGESLKYEVLEELMRESLQDALKQESLDPAGMPQVEPKEFAAGQPFEYVATFEIFPEFELRSLENVELTEKTANINEADVSATLNRIIENHADWVAADRAAAEGDKITIDFLGKLNDKAFEGGTAKKFDLKLGSKSMIPGFEEQLIGVKAGDEKVISVTFPEDYPHQDLAGKETTFDIVVHTVLAAQHPELNDAFAEKLGIKEGGVEKLKEEVKASMERELENRLKGEFKLSVLDKLRELNAFEIPNALIKSEIQELKKMAATQSRGQVNAEDLPDEMYQEDAAKRVHLGLIMKEALKKFDIKADEEKIKEKILQLAASYGNTEQVMQLYYQNPHLVREIEGMVLEEQVIDHLAKTATIKKATTDYNTVMGFTDEQES